MKSLYEQFVGTYWLKNCDIFVWDSKSKFSKKLRVLNGMITINDAMDISNIFKIYHPDVPDPNGKKRQAQAQVFFLVAKDCTQPLEVFLHNLCG